MGNLGGLRQKATVDDGIARMHQSKGVHVVDYQPGNGTRYVLMLSDFPDGAENLLGCQQGSVIVHDFNRGRAYPFVRGGGLLHYNYVKEKLGYYSDVDAVVVAEMLGQLLDREAVSCEDYTLVQETAGN